MAERTVMLTEIERIRNAETWREGGGVDAVATDLNPNQGPVWVAWSNPNYVPFTERFDTAANAADEMWRRLSDSYYPMWDDTVALIYGTNPDEQDVYPLVELQFSTDNPETVTLQEC